MGEDGERLARIEETVKWMKEWMQAKDSAHIAEQAACRACAAALSTKIEANRSNVARLFWMVAGAGALLSLLISYTRLKAAGIV